MPTAEAAAAMVAFTNLAQLFVDGRVLERWIVDTVSEIPARSDDAGSVMVLPLGQLYGVGDERGAGWGRTDAGLRAAIRQACLAQLRLAAG